MKNPVKGCMTLNTDMSLHAIKTRNLGLYGTFTNLEENNKILSTLSPLIKTFDALNHKKT